MTRVVVPGTEPATPGTIAYFFREALRRLWISRRTTFVAIAMIAISLLVLGSFLLLAENLERTVAQWQGRSKLTIYIEPDAPEESVRAIDHYLDANPALSNRRFVTRDEALQKFKTYFTNLSGVLDQLEQNPFPPSFEVEVTSSTIQSHQFEVWVSEIHRLPGVDDVQFDWEWIARLKNLVNILTFVGFLAGGILAVAAAFTIANVIRLTMVTYREEIDIMRLVGATEKMIRGPFLVEGVLQGTIGGLLAVGLLYGGFVGAQRMITPSSALLWEFLFVTFLPWPKLLYLVGGGMLAGLIGSWLSLRENTEEVPLILAEPS